MTDPPPPQGLAVRRAEEPPDAAGPVAMRHVVLGAAVLGTDVTVGVVRIALWPLKPFGRVAVRVLPVRRLAVTMADAGVEVERRLIQTGERVVESRRLDELAGRLAASDRVAELATQVLSGPLSDRVAAIVVERALTSAETEELISRTLERPELERLIVLALDSPATDRIVRRVLASPGVELAVRRVLESELLDAATVRFLESGEFEQVIERIAQGPELRAAVAAQSAGLADLVAGEVRDRSVSADDTAERIAKSLVPRRWRRGGPAGAAGA